ncbi:hypothetical protein HPB50_017513 [Hyalomma asiaticum]|uniref:Uncharacterized protein n=1 Tax=Hyalomma asiaticum TaxID=266040 RepID=A0ACB7SFD6_HYAAI|nr:hypothetical protein HPB50_017513 [Hyalomma asiaticum]
MSRTKFIKHFKQAYPTGYFAPSFTSSLAIYVDRAVQHWCFLELLVDGNSLWPVLRGPAGRQRLITEVLVIVQQKPVEPWAYCPRSCKRRAAGQRFHAAAKAAVLTMLFRDYILSGPCSACRDEFVHEFMDGPPEPADVPLMDELCVKDCPTRVRGLCYRPVAVPRIQSSILMPAERTARLILVNTCTHDFVTFSTCLFRCGP